MDVNVTINTILNFDVDASATCEQGLGILNEIK